jgi:hypothetical protein
LPFCFLESRKTQETINKLSVYGFSGLWNLPFFGRTLAILMQQSLVQPPYSPCQPDVHAFCQSQVLFWRDARNTWGLQLPSLPFHASGKWFVLVSQVPQEKMPEEGPEQTPDPRNTSHL